MRALHFQAARPYQLDLKAIRAYIFEADRTDFKSIYCGGSL